MNHLSILKSLPDDEFINLIKTSVRIADVLKKLNLARSGRDFLHVKKKIIDLGLDTSHFLSRTASSVYGRQVRCSDFKRIYLVANSNKARSCVKKYLIRFNILPYTCTVCNNAGTWNDKQLSLHLEHKNGISNDNRLENLCFLCPNCHSQTPTYAGRNAKKVKKEIIKTVKKRKSNRPSAEELQSLIQSMPTTHVAKKFNVSDVAVAKWCKFYGLSKPPRGFWQKLKKLEVPDGNAPSYLASKAITLLLC